MFRFGRVGLDEQRTRRFAFAFTVFLIFFESQAVGVDYSNFTIQLIDIESVGFATFTAVFLVASVYLVYRFFFDAFRAPWAFRIVYVALFALAAGAEYSYQKALGRFSQIIDIEIAAATTFEQKVASFAMYFGFASFIPLAVFILLLAITRGDEEKAFRKFALTGSLTIACLMACSVMSMSRFPTLSTYAFYRTNFEFLLFGPISNGKWASEFTGIQLKRLPAAQPSLPPGHHPANNVIVVVDESVRGDHLSLNGYGRSTTPFLEKLQAKGVLHNWGLAAAAASGSHSSYTAIITGLRPNDFPDPGEVKRNMTPTMFQLAKAMGYKTWYFDGQMKTYWGGIDDDVNFIDNLVGAGDVTDPNKWGKWDVDREIARRVNKVIGSSTGNFIFVFKYGSHIPYQFNFPPDEAHWQPSYTFNNRFEIPPPERHQEVVNAYDNSIRYSIDPFFELLIDDYDRIPNNTVILYTGDHGQTLYANGMASHGGTTRAEATVPLFVIGRTPNRPDTRYKASHCNIYTTVADLIDYPQELRREELCVSLLKAKSSDSGPRFFNPQLGPGVPFD